ncbi:MAG: NUDIX hydrolase [Actinomycetes bacterium]
MRRWQVGGALIRRDGGLLLVANRRRDRSVDWTPPGGVIDPGETVTEGLVREVREETGLEVHTLVRCAYRVEVEAPDLDWILHVEAWEVEAAGDVCIADPDGIVEHCRCVPFAEVPELLTASPAWIQVPIGHWLGLVPAAPADGAVTRSPEGPNESSHVSPSFRFRLYGTDRRSTRVERIG